MVVGEAVVVVILVLVLKLRFSALILAIGRLWIALAVLRNREVLYSNVTVNDSLSGLKISLVFLVSTTRIPG